jgi:GxxExxY protein
VPILHSAQLYSRNLLAWFLLTLRLMITETVDELTETVIGLAMRVHDALGPGLLETVYRECFVLELVANGLIVEVERRVPIIYREQQIRDHLRLDILVNNLLVLEIKAVERLLAVHKAQLVTYRKLSGFPAGLLFNFNATSVRAGMHRLDHPDVYNAKKIARMARPR